MSDAAAAIATSKNFRAGEDGAPEKRCSKCNEWWPADLEFFYANRGKPGDLSDWCHACYADHRAHRRERGL